MHPQSVTWQDQWTHISIKKEDKKTIEAYKKAEGLSGGAGAVAVHAIQELKELRQAIDKEFGSPRNN